MTAGRSCQAEADRLRRAQPWWRRLLVFLGFIDPPRSASNFEAGAVGERLTAKLLAPLLREGWHILHDRTIPGGQIDHVLVSPDGLFVITLDTKMWSRLKGMLDVTSYNRLVHGDADRHKAITGVKWQADCAASLLVVPAYPVIVMHSAPVAGGLVQAAGVPVVAPGGLLELLRALPKGRPDRQRARLLAAAVQRKLPAYR